MASKSRKLVVSVQIDGVRETLNAFRDLPKEASNELRDAAQGLAETMLVKVKAAAAADRSPQARLVAGTAKVKRDRVPVLEVGGTKRLGRNREPAYEILFGAEFGSNRYKQFHKRHTGRAGSWFFPIVERESAEIGRQWNAAADRIIRKFGEG